MAEHRVVGGQGSPNHHPHLGGSLWERGTHRDPQLLASSRNVHVMADQKPVEIRGDVRAQIREFLTTRRARITPQQAGLPVYGSGRRRVTGLRREEVALLAGVSIEYYIRLERGTATGVSEGVIDGVTHALQLDDAERAHLVDLLRAAGPVGPARRRVARQHVRSTVQRVLDSMFGTPAFVLNARHDVLGANALGRALFSQMYADSAGPNSARFTFLDPRAIEFFRDWHNVGNDVVALLRAEAGRDPYDRQLSDLIGELSTRSHEFRVRWAAHDVRVHTTGAKLLHHPVVGDLDLAFDTFPLGADPGQILVTYTAEPGSRSQDALNLLASWSATIDTDEEPGLADDVDQAERTSADDSD
ncbi:MAG: helix-turn-helix domain protein [Ilumatobacteraceae bacterium]|nr:helix-turn-helix domain protein [Ilumatobacteraceae bacterium]